MFISKKTIISLGNVTMYLQCKFRLTKETRSQAVSWLRNTRRENLLNTNSSTNKVHVQLWDNKEFPLSKKRCTRNGSFLLFWSRELVKNLVNQV